MAARVGRGVGDQVRKKRARKKKMWERDATEQMGGRHHALSERRRG